MKYVCRLVWRFGLFVGRLVGQNVVFQDQVNSFLSLVCDSAASTLYKNVVAFNICL